MSIMHFQSAVALGEPVKLTGATVRDEDPASAAASLVFQTNGALVFTADSPSNPTDEWYRNQPEASVGDDWEVRCTVNSGVGPNLGDATSTWLALTIARTWGLARGTTGAIEGRWQLELRRAGSTFVAASDEFIVQAEVTV